MARRNKQCKLGRSYGEDEFKVKSSALLWCRSTDRHCSYARLLDAISINRLNLQRPAVTIQLLFN